MKGFTAMMRILIALTSLALTLMLVLSILPIATGQLGITQDEEFQVVSDGYDINVHGSLKISSNLNEDVKDVNVFIYAESDKGMQLIILDETRTIKAGETISFPFDVTVSLPEAIMFMIAENNGKTEPGLTMPLNIGVSGLYFHDMLGFKFDMDYSLQVSESASVSIDAPLKNAEGKIKEVNAKVSGILPEDQINSFLPDGETISADLGFGTEDSIGLSVSNSSGVLSIKVTTGTEKAIQDAAENLMQKAQSGTDIVVSIGGEQRTITADQAAGLCDVLSKYVDISALEAIA